MHKTIGKLTFGVDDYPYRRVIKVEVEKTHWEFSATIALYRWFAYLSWER
jgi:hypothetical protein